MLAGRSFRLLSSLPQCSRLLTLLFLVAGLARRNAPLNPQKAPLYFSGYSFTHYYRVFSVCSFYEITYAFI